MKSNRRGIEQPGQVGRETDLGDHDRVIGLGRQGARRRAVAFLRIVSSARRADSGSGRSPVPRPATGTRFSRHAPFAHDADRDISSLVKRIDRVNKGCGKRVIDTDRDGQQPAIPTRLSAWIIPSASTSSQSPQISVSKISRQARRRRPGRRGHHQAKHRHDDQRRTRSVHEMHPKTQARICLMMCAGSTPVRRWSSP